MGLVPYNTGAGAGEPLGDAGCRRRSVMLPALAELEASMLLVSLCPQKVWTGATGLRKDLIFLLLKSKVDWGVEYQVLHPFIAFGTTVVSEITGDIPQ